MVADRAMFYFGTRVVDHVVCAFVVGAREQELVVGICEAPPSISLYGMMDLGFSYGGEQTGSDGNGVRNT